MAWVKEGTLVGGGHAPDPSAQPDNRWLRTTGGALVYVAPATTPELVHQLADDSVASTTVPTSTSWPVGDSHMRVAANWGPNPQAGLVVTTKNGGSNFVSQELLSFATDSIVWYRFGLGGLGWYPWTQVASEGHAHTDYLSKTGEQTITGNLIVDGRGIGKASRAITDEPNVGFMLERTISGVKWEGGNDIGNAGALNFKLLKDGLEICRLQLLEDGLIQTNEFTGTAPRAGDFRVRKNLEVWGHLGTWTNLPLGSGWVGASGLRAPRYRKVGDEVAVEGEATRSSGTSSIIGTLPAGSVPLVARRFSITIDGALGVVQANTNGTLQLVTGTISTTAIVTLGAIRFSVL